MQIYIHIPFCIRKCQYCAFNSIAAEENLIDEYIEALCLEIERFKNHSSISTIYFGGGTPSILTLKQFKKIFDTLHSNFNLENTIEITVEANPGTVDYKYLKELKTLGVNRLSLGVQSFDDNLLKILGRIHNRQQAIEIIETAKKIFDNVSIDLMYDLPKQNLNALQKSLEMAMELEVQHISIYGLEIEENTGFERLYNVGKLNLPNDEESNKMYDYITSELPKRDWRRYEISNYAKKDFESQHNLGYWSDVEYLGLGAGAHSYVNSELGMQNAELKINDNSFGIRWSNILNVNDYIEYINCDKDIRNLEELIDKKAAIEEFCFLSLRKAEGIDIIKFKNKFEISLDSIYHKIIKNLCEKNLIESVDNKIKLTKLGMKYGNQVFQEFLLS